MEISIQSGLTWSEVIYATKNYKFSGSGYWDTCSTFRATFRDNSTRCLNLSFRYK